MRTRSGSSAAITARDPSHCTYSGVLWVFATNAGGSPGGFPANAGGSGRLSAARWSLWRQHGRGLYALFSLTNGAFNTAIGWESIATATTASFNTGVGAGTLALNNGDENTASGAGALLLNSTGAANTANGALSLLFSNGSDNSAFGDRALQNNTTGSFNIAVGSQAG